MDITHLPRDWENPNVFSRNKCRSHVPLRAHPNPDSALLYFIKDPKAADNANLLTLNSSGWSFQLYDRPEDVPKAFSNPDYDDGQWGKVISLPVQVLEASGVSGQQGPNNNTSAWNKIHALPLRASTEWRTAHLPPGFEA